MVAKRHKITNVPLFKKLWDIIFFLRDNNFLSHFSGHFEGASTFLTPQNVPRIGSKSYCPAKKKIMSRSFLNRGTLIVKTLLYIFHNNFARCPCIDDQSWVLLLSRGPQRKLHSEARNPLPASNICTSVLGRSPRLTLYRRLSYKIVLVLLEKLLIEGTVQRDGSCWKYVHSICLY